MKLFDRIKGLFGMGSAEGSFRGPYLGQSELGRWIEVDPLSDGWQRNLQLDGAGANKVAIVYACVMLYCRAISQCHPMHFIGQTDGGDKRSKTSPASRVLRYPNEYETWTQFIFQIVANMKFEGEALCLKVRDDRNAVVALHRIPRRNWSIHAEPESQEIFYGVNEFELYGKPDILIPAREVVHFRMHCPRHPLIGESPIKSAAAAIGINVALNRSQLAFFSQMARPSGVVSTDMQLSKDQINQLRQNFNEQSKVWAQGGTPILTSGLKWTPVNITQTDSQLIEQQRLSSADVARVFGVPMALLADTSAPQAGTEALISSWLSVGLGSIIENIERSLDRCFDLPANQHIQLDPQPLLRVDFDKRIEGWKSAVNAGIIAPNEVRLREGFGPKDGGEELYMQRQMTSLDVLTDLARADLENKIAKNEELASAKDPMPVQPPAPPSPEQAKAVVINLFHKHKKRAAS